MRTKLFATLVISMMLAAALSACSQSQAPSSAASTSEESIAATASATSQSSAESLQAPSVHFETLQDVFDAPGTDAEMTYDEKRFIEGYRDGDWYYRAVASLPDGLKAELDATILADNEEFLNLLGPLPVDKVDVIPYPSETEYAAYVGMSGAELAAEGFTFKTLVINGNVTECSATLGSFDYLITFDGVVSNEDAVDIAAEVKGMSAKSVSVQSLSWEAFSAE